MILEINHFIKKNKNWRELLSLPPYSLEIKEKSDLSIINYTKYTEKDNKIGKEANGIIIDNEMSNVICMKFRRFFNHTEKHKANINKPYRVYEKIDGSLICFYYFNNQWNISSKTLIGYNFNLDDNENQFYKMVKKVLHLKGTNLNKFTQQLNRDKTYCFELVTPLNPIIVDYCGIWEIFLLSVRDRYTFIEENIDNINIDYCSKPKKFNYTIEEVVELTKSINELSIEGFVIVDSIFNRVKFKTEFYLKTRNNFIKNGR